MKIKLFFIIYASSLIVGSCSKSSTDSNPVTPTTLPTLGVTSPASAITTTTAISGGTIVSDGGATIIARGVCWSTTSNPSIANTKTSDGTGAGAFTSAITGLSLTTTYYVRAYATNSIGTAYGNEISFTTSATIVLPTITTTALTSINSSSAVSGGNIISDGGATVTARGVCWSISTSPTTANTKTADGTGLGTFNSNLIGLTENTVYYVRAYATNSAGTAYGNEINFTTLQAPQPGTVYIGGSNNKFYALNALTGQIKWQYNGTSGFSYAGPCYANGKVYAGSIDSYLYCMDSLNGNVNWRFLAGNTGIESDPVYDNGSIYFGSNDDYLYSLNANTGTMNWRFLTGANVSTSPVVHNGVVFFGSSDSKVYAVNTSTGQLIWSYQTGAMINQSGPAIANGLLYVGSRDGYLYALDVNTGALVWRYAVNNISLEMSSPTVVNNIVYIAGWHDIIVGTSNKGSVYAINASTGQLVWEKYQNTGFGSSPIVADGKLFITNESGDLLAMDAITGTQLWTRTILSNGASPAVMNGIVYVGGGGTNYFYAIDAITGIDIWRFSISNSLFISSPCIITTASVKYSGESGMQQ